MKQKTPTLRRAAALLLAAAALPLTPTFAQDAAPIVAPPAPEAAVPPPVVNVTPPPPPVTAAPTIPAAPPPSAAPVADQAPVAETAAPRAIRTTTRTPVRIAPRTAQFPTEPIAATPEPVAPAPVAEPPVVAAPAPAPVAETPPAPAPQQTRQPQNVSILPWLFGALVVIGLAALLFRRRRRVADEVYYDEAVETPVAIAEPEPTIVAPVAETGEPAIDLTMRPIRAGVDEDVARVEFELTLGNHGDATARDVKVSTWMIPSGAQATEMEQLLIDRPQSRVGKVDAGDTQRIESAVTLRTDGITDDSVLPVVVAEARYRLSDGSEQTATASFAVGVPLDGELARFDIENPSGMHDDVEARPIGELEAA